MVRLFVCSCADGYFGDPEKINDTCTVCDCNGNIDPAAIGNCDSSTGRCLKCIYNTIGDQCELCRENHYGSALDHKCTPCGCHLIGAESPTCNNVTGICECKENYEGDQCDRCIVSISIHLFIV